MSTQRPFPTCGVCGRRECICLDLADRIQCATCEDRGYVTTHAEFYGNPVTYTDPCPHCNKDYGRTTR